MIEALRLYSYWRSSCSWRVRIALAVKGIGYEYVPVHLVRDGGEQRTETYRAVNPLQQVPTIEWREHGQTRRLTQSMAILEWLEERHPQPSLLPRDPYLRAKTRQLAEMVNAGIQPLQNLSGLKRLEELGVDRAAWGREWIARGLRALERATQEVAGRHSVGDALTFADLLLVPQLYNARRHEVQLGDVPTLLRIEAACNELDAFIEAHPDRQPDAPSKDQG